MVRACVRDLAFEGPAGGDGVPAENALEAFFGEVDPASDLRVGSFGGQGYDGCGRYRAEKEDKETGTRWLLIYMSIAGMVGPGCVEFQRRSWKSRKCAKAS